ncbi:MAG: prenyltransferase/squalene oxidase repeat-containing protein [Chloroflexota bacterium]
MSFYEHLLDELQAMVMELGTDGGLISPSVYDTAQVLRLCPPEDGVEAALTWLVEQQRPDGGWGNPAAPLSRDVPTLAALLTLNQRYKSNNGCLPQSFAAVIEAGLCFLEQQAPQWLPPLSENLPVAVEMILPHLLEEAAAVGLHLDQKPYTAIKELGQNRRQLIAKLSLQAGTPPIHSWEAWGKIPAPDLVDGSGSVGHSPAATAAWLHQVNLSTNGNGRPPQAQQARRYLHEAAQATQINLPGVVPTVWPITRFEQSFVLHTLLLTDLLHHPQLQNVVMLQARNMAGHLKPKGLGMSDFFLPDGDDTAAALAILQAVGLNPDLGTLSHFKNGDHFYAYQGELQPSLSLTARALHTLTLFDKWDTASSTFILERRMPDGRWVGDKWHSSWLYTTYLAVLALTAAGEAANVSQTIRAVVANQLADGGWGETGRATAVETALGVLILVHMSDQNMLSAADQATLKRGAHWLYDHYTAPSNGSQPPRWLGKALYTPYRIDRTIELSALLLVLQGEILHV